MSWKDLPRSGFHQLPTQRPDGARKGYVTGAQVMDRLIAVRWGSDALRVDDAATISARLRECVEMLVSAAEAEQIEGLVEHEGEMRPLQPTDWNERTLEQWEYDLLDSEIERRAHEPTLWANGKTLMFDKEPVAEWIESLAPCTAESPENRGPSTSMPRFSRAKAESEYQKRVARWPAGKKHPSRSDDEKWFKKEFGVGRTVAREIRNKFAPNTWTVGGAPRSVSRKLGGK